MPVYEYSCNACGARQSVFVRSMNSEVTAVCERCGTAEMRRLVSRFAVLRSAGDLEGLDALYGDVDENDPQAVAERARAMQNESSEDLGADFSEMVGHLERGEPADTAEHTHSHDD